MADEQSEFDVVAEQIEQQENAESKNEPSVVDEILPDEFKGKSAAEIAKIALHARNQMGKMGNELGEVRRLADELIKSQLSKPKDKEEVSAEIDIFDNPQEYVRRAVESNPRVQAAEQYAVMAKQEMAKQKLLQEHPDALSLAQDTEFSKWVNGSSVRKELFQRANGYDVDAASELFSTYKELKAVRANAISDAEKSARKQAISSAEVDSGGSGERSKKIFKRSDLLNKMAFDKKWYEANKAEISLAYAEGRVR